jgi:asparagine synthase (glutamine-hydrolysing)
MCGIFFYKYLSGQKVDVDKMTTYFNRIKHRGPDKSVSKILGDDTFIGFHRLAINGLTEMGDQPFIYEKENGTHVYVICNGEIYNYIDLNEKYELELEEGESDCAVIYPLFEKVGLEKMINLLDGVFAFVIYDEEDGSVYAGRDPIGVRPLFYGIDKNQIAFCSEGKGICELMEVIPFPAGSYYMNGRIKRFFMIDDFRDVSPNPYLSLVSDSSIYYMVEKVFRRAVLKRLLSERPIGCLLSGGLDSSLVAAIVQEEMKKNGKCLNTYSIGFKGSPDLEKARVVAEHIGSNHHEVIMNFKDIEKRIPEIIMQLETWDTTTIRASIGMFLLSEYISQKTEDVVIFSGEGADELCQGYLYFHRQPSPASGTVESFRLINDLYMYDVLRADRTTAGHGLELRVPFLDKEFMKLISSLSSRKVCPRNGAEKYLIRRSFQNSGLLPDEILWRTKEAFSDGVSSVKNNWLDKLKTMAASVISDESFEKFKGKCSHCVPRTKEEMYYRQIYGAFYKNDQWIPRYWMPMWSGETIDPSARTLNIYQKYTENENEIEK